MAPAVLIMMHIHMDTCKHVYVAQKCSPFPARIDTSCARQHIASWIENVRMDRWRVSMRLHFLFCLVEQDLFSFEEEQIFEECEKSYGARLSHVLRYVSKIVGFDPLKTIFEIKGSTPNPYHSGF